MQGNNIIIITATAFRPAQNTENRNIKAKKATKSDNLVPLRE
jgi:hypothetical protein